LTRIGRLRAHGVIRLIREIRKIRDPHEQRFSPEVVRGQRGSPRIMRIAADSLAQGLIRKISD
jgi:hypothetical protein